MFVLVVLCVQPLLAQVEFSEAENPLARLKDQVGQVLGEADLDFSPEQESAIVLMMEDHRRASEDLFGDLMDFRAGPTQGQETDRLQSAIDWMEGEFVSRLNDYLTREQSIVWNDFIDQGGLEELGIQVEGLDRTDSELTQYVRIHNNAYTAEDDLYRFGQRGNGSPGPEVIARGGAGDFHGNIEFLIKDDALNARNPFAQNKPPYQERQVRVDVSGPLIRGRLTTGFSFGQNEAENVDTVHATLPDGVFELGIVRPTTNRSYSTNNTVRISDDHSLDLTLIYETGESQNQGIGGFTLPERAYTSSGNNWHFATRQFSSLSSRSIYETRFTTYTSNSDTLPVNTGVQINVLDAFQSGGAQNRSEIKFTGYEFGNMYTRVGESWTLKTGVEGIYTTTRSFSEANFGGRSRFRHWIVFSPGLLSTIVRQAAIRHLKPTSSNWLSLHKTISF